MTLRNRLVVHKKSGAKRMGRGFSREELKKAGINLKQALRIELPIDTRRRTAHDYNVKLLKKQLKNLRTAKKHVSKPNKKAS